MYTYKSKTTDTCSPYAHAVHVHTTCLETGQHYSLQTIHYTLFFFSSNLHSCHHSQTQLQSYGNKEKEVRSWCCSRSPEELYYSELWAWLLQCRCFTRMHKKKSVKNIAASVILCFAQSTACFQHNSASSLNPTDKKHKYFPWPPNSELIAHWAGEKQCVCVTKQSHLGQLADVDLEVSSTVSVHTD